MRSTAYRAGAILLALALVLHGTVAAQTATCPDSIAATWASVDEADARRGKRRFEEPIILFVSPTDAQLAQWRASFRSEEDFHVMADDANWYRSEAFDYLRCQTYADVLFLERGPLEFLVGGETWRYEFRDLPFLDEVVVRAPGSEPARRGSFLDLIVAYRPGMEPLLVPPIAVWQLTDYFSPRP